MREGGPPPAARLLSLVGVGFAFPIAILIGAGAGWFLDGWLGTGPWLAAVGLICGVAAGFRNLLRAVSASVEEE